MFVHNTSLIIVLLVSSFLECSADAKVKKQIDHEFELFWKDLKLFVKDSNFEKIAANTSFPFLYENNQTNQSAFVKKVAPVLFESETKKCFSEKFPVNDYQSPDFLLSCRKYTFYFRKIKSRWLFAEFSPNTPD